MSSIEATIADAAPEIIHGMNVDFEDSTLFVARVLGERPSATAARITALEPTGVHLDVTDADGESAVEIRFDAAVGDLSELTVALFGLVLRAREVSGEEGMTSAERQMAAMTSYRTLVTEVVAVEDVHPHLRRITFGGDDLAGLQLPGPDAFFYVLLPPPGRTDLTIDQSFTWEAHSAMPEAERPVGAYYTVRRWDPAARQVEMLFVLHDSHDSHGDDDGDGDDGPASSWAASSWAAKATVGDPAALWGPRTAFAPPAGTDRYLLVADETGLPAVAAIIESLPPEVPVQVVAEAADATSRQELPPRPAVSVTWCHRDGADPGTTSLLLDAVTALPPLTDTTYVWGGGESRTLAAVRRHVRHERGLSREAVALITYWRRAGAGADPDAQLGADEGD